MLGVLHIPGMPGVPGLCPHLVEAVSCNVQDNDMHMLGIDHTHFPLLAPLDVALPYRSGVEDALAGPAKSAFG